MASPAAAGASEENYNNNDSCIIEISEESEPELTSDSFMNEIPKDLELDLTGEKNIIFRVPRKLRKLNEAAYTPNLISIGPFHYGKRELGAMENHKKEYYKLFRGRTSKSGDDLKRFIKSEEVHGSYAGTMEFEKDSPKFEKIILRDACFIIELFLRNKEKQEDYILRTAWLKKAIQLDLILLENQLPYFLLETLYNEAYCKPKDSESTSSSSSNPVRFPFLILVREYFGDLVSDKDDEGSDKKESDGSDKKESDSSLPLLKQKGVDDGSDKKKSDGSDKNIKHFTDLVRQVRLPSNKNRTIQPRDDYLYCATELDKAGVSFVVNDGARLADVKLSDGWYSLQLKLPLLILDDATELLFRNMMALEQCLHSSEAYICNYVTLMSQLINTDQDVDFLVEKKIIKNLSSHGVAHLFTKLSSETSVSYFWYATEFNRLNAYHDKWFNRTMTTAKKTYFTDLWKTSSTVLGFFLLLFSISGSVKNIFLS